MSKETDRVRVKIICEDCLRRVDVYWQSRGTTIEKVMHYDGNVAHVHCHGEHRLAVLPMVITTRAHNTVSSFRVGEVMVSDDHDPGEVIGTVMWGSLEDFAIGPKLQEFAERFELQATHYLEVVQVIERVLKGQAPNASDTQIAPERRMVTDPD